LKVTPHVAQDNPGRRSAVSDAIAVSPVYALSPQKRKQIERGFGWVKSVGRIRQVIARRIRRLDQYLVLMMTAYEPVRMRTLGAVCPWGA
jgi:hypothetical protein